MCVGMSLGGTLSGLPAQPENFDVVLSFIIYPGSAKNLVCELGNFAKSHWLRRFDLVWCALR